MKQALIKSLTKEEFGNLVQETSSITNLITKLKLAKNTFTYTLIRKRMIEEGLEFTVKRSHSKPKPLQEHLVENSRINRGFLKEQLIKNNLIENKCCECNLGPNWNNKKLVLHIDHINGIRNDNRLENLRLLCPNCHSQTDTYGGKNLPKNIRHKKCLRCPNRIDSHSSVCHKCAMSLLVRERKLSITKDQLEKLVWEKPTQLIAKELLVTDTLIGKYCKKWGIVKPPRGYWAKLKYSKISV